MLTGGRVHKNLTFADAGEAQNGPKNADVINERPLIHISNRYFVHKKCVNNFFLLKTLDKRFGLQILTCTLITIVFQNIFNNKWFIHDFSYTHYILCFYVLNSSNKFWFLGRSKLILCNRQT